jgi:hypothetical protein
MEWTLALIAQTLWSVSARSRSGLGAPGGRVALRSVVALADFIDGRRRRGGEGARVLRLLPTRLEVSTDRGRPIRRYVHERAIQLRY